MFLNYSSKYHIVRYGAGGGFSVVFRLILCLFGFF